MKCTQKILISLPLILFAAASSAESHHAEAGHEALSIPWHSIFVQGFNFILLFGLLGWLLRKTVKSHFEERATQYRELVDRAENAKRQAEESHHKIKERLSALESSAEANLIKARSEAEELKQKMIREAQGLAGKLQQEAQRTAEIELEKAKNQLRRELLGKALAASSENLRKGLGVSDQQKLQNEFAEKIEVVAR